jgi:serine/threonine protein kinase
MFFFVLKVFRLCGFPPFYEENLTDLYEQILSADYDFPEEYWGKISDSAKDLVARLLKVDPKERYTAKQTLKHPWIVVLFLLIVCLNFQ